MQPRIEDTPLPGVRIVHPGSFDDHRGFFSEVYREDEFAKAGMPARFVQVNHSKSAKHVLRGLHFQYDPPLGKLMRVIAGRAFLVAVDLRTDSPTLGRWYGREFTAASKQQLWAPASFARGVCALEEGTEIEYFCTAQYNAPGETGVRWNDPAIGITWPVKEPVLSERDTTAQTLAQWLARPESRRFTLAT